MTPTCSTNGCVRTAKVRGMCLSCYGHAWRKRTIPIKRYKARRWAAFELPPAFELFIPWSRHPMSEARIQAKRRICEFWLEHPGMEKSELSRILGIKYATMLHWMDPDWGYFPTAAHVPIVHAALDAYERQHPPPTP